MVMDTPTAFVVIVYGLAGAGAVFSWWTYHRRVRGFKKVKCHSRSMSNTLTFHRVRNDDADALVAAHQNGNRGPRLLNMRNGGKASVDVGEFVSIEIG